jgi:hypothetical protein
LSIKRNLALHTTNSCTNIAFQSNVKCYVILVPVVFLLGYTALHVSTAMFLYMAVLERDTKTLTSECPTEN